MVLREGKGGRGREGRKGKGREEGEGKGGRGREGKVVGNQIAGKWCRLTMG